jgi:hypothetical protein
MTFWIEVFAGFLANVFAGVLLVILYVVIQWFLQAIDVTVGYNWRWQGQDFRPSFDIRNRSKSKIYLLANIAYTKEKGVTVSFDNKSLWGQELRPGSINFLDAVSPVKNVHSISECLELEVSVRLQNGRAFWLKGQGPGQIYVGRIQRIAFWLRKVLETAAVPME